MSLHLWFGILTFSTLGYGIGYDFSHCSEQLDRLSQALQAELSSEDFIETLHRKEWSDRQARLHFVRRNEERRATQAAETMLKIQNDHPEMVRSMVELLSDSEKRAQEIEDTKEDIARMEKRDDSRDIVALRRYLAVLQNPRATVKEITAALEENEAAQIRSDADFSELLESHIGSKENIFGAWLQLTGQPSTHPGETRKAQDAVQASILVADKADVLPPQAVNGDYARIMKATGIAVEVLALSEMRTRTIERLVGAVPLDQPLSSAKDELATKTYQEELLQFLEAVTQKAEADGSKPVPGFQLLAKPLGNEEKRQRFLRKAKRLAKSSRLSPFLREDLSRHIRFVEEFGIPIDFLFVQYVQKLNRI